MYPTSDIMMGGAEAEALAAFIAIFGTALLAILIISLIVAIFMVIVYWKLFKKAGQPGWAAIVPFYNSVVLSKVAGVNIWFYLGIVIASVVGGFIPEVTILATIANFVWMIVIAFKLPSKFGKGAGFGVGLWLLPVIFYPILAFGKSEYQG